MLAMFAIAHGGLSGGCGISLKEQTGNDVADGGVVPGDGSSGGATCSNGRVVYLHFEGLTLTRVPIGQTDAALDQADWLDISSANVPAFKENSAMRAGEIQQITDALRRSLGQFPISVVTQRPSAGPYHMVVFGGNSLSLGNTGGAGALAAYDCGNKVSNSVVWIGELFSPQESADYAVGGLGLGLGLTGTTDTADCMCGWGNTCQPSSTGACTLAASINNDGGCNNDIPQQQNEIDAFRREFCQPLP